MEQQPQEFTPKMTEIARRIKHGKQPATTRDYVHVDHFQKMSAIKDEIDRNDARRALSGRSTRRPPRPPGSSRSSGCSTETL